MQGFDSLIKRKERQLSTQSGDTDSGVVAVGLLSLWWRAALFAQVAVNKQQDMSQGATNTLLLDKWYIYMH